MIKFLMLILLPLLLFAIEGKVELNIDKNQEIFVSKKLKVTLKIMSTGFNISNLKVDFTENKNFVIVEPKSALYNTTEDDYSVVVYEYDIYPLKSGKLTLLPWNISFESSMGYGTTSKNIQTKTKSISLFVDSIKGYDFILSTPLLKVETYFDSVKGNYNIGDAIERKVIITAHNVPDVLIPSVDVKDSENFKVYIDEPKLKQTKGTNGELISTRTQKESYIFIKDGNFTIPSENITWYNVNSRKVEKVKTKSINLNVKSNQKEEKLKKKTFSFELIYLVYILLIIAVFYFIYKAIMFLRSKNKTTLKRSRSLLIETINPKLGKK